MPLPRFVDYSLRFIAPISLCLAIYYHYQAVQERVPTYYVSPDRARIVDTSVPAPTQLQVLYRGKELNTNVSAATVYVWNAGKLPIKADDVLEGMRIELEPGSEILDARVTKVSRPVTNLTEGEISEAAKNVLPLRFSILEHDDGGVFQIIYAGKPDATVSMRSTVVGADHPAVVVGVQKTPRERRALKRMRYLVWIPTALLTLMAMYGFWKFRDVGGPSKKPLVIGLVVINVLLVAYFTYHVHRTLEPGIPATIWAEE